MILTPPFYRWEKRGSCRSKVAAWNCKWGSRDVSSGSPSPEPARSRILRRTIFISSTLGPMPLEIPSVCHIPPGAGLSGPRAGRTKQSLSVGKSEGRRPRLGFEAAVHTLSLSP